MYCEWFYFWVFFYLFFFFFCFFFLSKSSNNYFWCDNLYRIHNICKYFEFVNSEIIAKINACKGEGTCCMFIGVKNQQSKVVLLACYTPSWPYICPYQKVSLSQTVWEWGPAQDFGIWRDNNGEVRVLLNTTCLLVLIYASTKYYQNISNHILKDLA